MSKVFIEESTLTAIGDSIRAKTGKTDMIPPLQMPTEIESIKGGGDAIIKTASGACPITLEDCIEGALLDYKIYGAEGGVGDQTENLFDKHYDIGYGGTAPNVSEAPDGLSTEWYAIEDIGTDFTYALNPSRAISAIVIGYIQSNDKSTISLRRGFTNASAMTTGVDNFGNFSITNTSYTYVKFYVNNAQAVNDIRIYKGNNNNLTTPYGFYFPIKVNDIEHKILLDLNSSLIDGDYIDFENRKVVIGGVPTMMELPEIYLDDGVNVIDVNTTVKPSSVSLTYVKSVEFNTMKTVEGTLPLTVKGVGQRLENYKIYGAEGGMGNPTKNLFDISRCSGTAAKATLDDYPGIDFMYFLDNGIGFTFVADFKENTQYTFRTLMHRLADKAGKGANGQIGYTDGTQQLFSILDGSITTVTSQQGKTISSIYTTAGWNSVAYLDLSVTQFEEGTEATAFEPYGYIVPLNVNDTISNIYIGDKALNTGDYIDYENRMVVSDGTSTMMELPEIHLADGVNVIDVNTTVKPSKMSVSYVEDNYGEPYIVTKTVDFSCKNEATLHRSACEQVIKSPHITNPSGTFAYRWNQLNDNGYISTTMTQNGVTFTNVGNGKLVLSGIATARVLLPVVSSSFMKTWDTSHKYYLRKLYPGSSASTIYWNTYNKLVVSDIILGSAMNFTANYPRICIEREVDTTGIEIIPQIFDLTMMFGEGNEPTIEQFEAMLSESYYPFNEGVDIYNLPITINGITTNYKYESGMTEFDLKDKIIIPEGDSTVSLPGTLSGTYLTFVSHAGNKETIEGLINQQLEVIENGAY